MKKKRKQNTTKKEAQGRDAQQVEALASQHEFPIMALTQQYGKWVCTVTFQLVADGGWPRAAAWEEGGGGGRKHGTTNALIGEVEGSPGGPMVGLFTLLQMSVRNPERSFCLLRYSRIIPGRGWSPFSCSNTYQAKEQDTCFLFSFQLI